MTWKFSGLMRAASTPAALPLAELLPYVMCGTIGEFGPVHLLEDGSVGFALEFDLPVVDTQIDGEGHVAALIDQSLRLLPAGVDWQWMVRCSPYVEPQIRRYLAQPGHDLVGQACAMQVGQRWRDAQREGFFPDDPQINFYPRSQSVVLALKSPPAALSAAGPGWPQFHEDLGKRTAGFIAAAQSLEGTIASLGVAPVGVDADRLANLVIDLLFPWRRFDSPPVRTGLHGAREAIGSHGRIDTVGGSGFRTVGPRAAAFHRVASMLWHPHAVRPGMLNALALMRPRLSICMCGRALDPASTAVRLKAQALLNARSANRFNEVETQARSQALEDVERRLFTEGERLIEGRLQVHVIEDSAEAADESARAVCEFLRGQDIEAVVEEEIGSSLILRGCLPFAIYEQTERKLRRRRRFLSRDFADLHPAGGAWSGLAVAATEAAASVAPLAMYSNPAGAPLFVDPSRAERNPHALVVGQSGSGKSFFVHDYLLHLWRLPQVRLYLISIKPDYRKLALLLGRYVELNLDCGECLNPFGGAPTSENQARWVAALGLMLTEGRDDRLLSREQEIVLQDACLAASARNWNVEAQCAVAQTQLEDVCVQLERRAGALGRDLAFQLLPYRRGPYRRLFNGPRTIGAADRFVFFNLGNILRQPCSAAACFCVFNLVDEVMHDASLRAVPKGLIADEAWALVQNPYAAGILERSLKAYRSLGGFALPIVQDPRDLDTPAGRVMLVNTATKIVLPMDRSGQDDICRFVRLNERELDLVRNLRLVKRRYSEFFVSIEGVHSGKGVLIPDPLRYAIATTDPADEARLDELQRQTGSMQAAVHRFASESPYGLTACAAGSGQRGGTLLRWLGGLSLMAAALAAYVATSSRSPAPQAAMSPTVNPPRAIAPASERATEQALQLLAADPPTHPLTIASAASDRREPDEHGLLAARGLLPAPAWRAPARPSETHPRPPIPDRIERGLPAGAGSDPLQAMNLQADLLEADTASAPLALVGIRADSTPPQARLRSSTGELPGSGAWFEPGDIVAPGWTLVDIDPESATLMSGLGLRVRLRPSIPNATDAAERRPSTSAERGD